LLQTPKVAQKLPSTIGQAYAQWQAQTDEITDKLPETSPRKYPVFSARENTGCSRRLAGNGQTVAGVAR